MCKPIGFVSDVYGSGKYVPCAKCGTGLRDDHGWAMDDGTVICKDAPACGLRQSHNEIEAAKAAGTWKPRWRKSD